MPISNPPRRTHFYGQAPTALVNIFTALAEKGVKVVPDTMVVGGGGAIDALASVMSNWVKSLPAGGKQG